MAIDADLNAGLITDDQARGRRAEIAQRSRLLRRDGRRLEVRQRRRDGGGDHHRHQPRSAASSWAWPSTPSRFTEATQQFSLLTVGDGLAAQIPALLISVATGIIVTRSASDKDLGSRHRRADPAPAQGAAGGRRCDRAVRARPRTAQAAVPLIAAIFGAIGWAVRHGLPGEEGSAFGPAHPAAALPRGRPALPRAGGTGLRGGVERTPLDALELAVGFGLVPLVDGSPAAARCCAASARSAARSPASWAMVIPAVRIHDELGLECHEYAVKVRGSEVARARIMPGHLLAMDPGDAAGTPAGHPHHRAHLRVARRRGCTPPTAPRPKRWATPSWTPSR